MKKIWMTAVASVMFVAGVLSHDMVENEKPHESTVNHEIATPWIEFKNGSKKDM